jgi:hypothetical protein
VPKCDGDRYGLKVRNARGTNRVRISRSRPSRRVHGYMSAACGERRTISRSAGSAVAPVPASNVNDHRDRDKVYFQDVTGSRCLLVQIPDRLSFGTQRTNILAGNDLTSQAVNFITLRRRPTAKILHAFQQA